MKKRDGASHKSGSRRSAPANQTARHGTDDPLLHPGLISSSTEPASAGSVVYVLGRFAAPELGAEHIFPLLERAEREQPSDFLARVVREIARVIAEGGTHLEVPWSSVDWLEDHPEVADYLKLHHALVEANDRSGIIFALRPPPGGALSVRVSGWEHSPDQELAFEAPRELRKPTISLLPKLEFTRALRGQLTLAANRLRTLRFRFDLLKNGSRRRGAHQIVFSLVRPGYLFHDLPFVALTHGADGQIQLAFNIELKKDQSLERIKIELVEEDNWRVHPGFISADSYAMPAVAPAGARLELQAFDLTPIDVARRHRSGDVLSSGRALTRPAPLRPRDAVLFSSWVPEEGLELGEYFLAMLRRWRSDAKFFVGVNHGSSRHWARLLAQSGLDVTIAPVPGSLDMPCDPAGFVAALDAFRADPEPFELIWFGHTKGMSHRDDPRYDYGRWMIERKFWSRRDEIARYFAHPGIGLYAPHYLMMDQKHLRQIDALRRMYDAPFQPLGVLALSTHFVMRPESVCDFCERVDPRFFREGPAPFGGSIYFFEMGMPNVPLAQGFEPAIEPGLGATISRTPEDGVSIQNDWRQNHVVVSAELAKWRRDPFRFRTAHREHRYVP